MKSFKLFLPLSLLTATLVGCQNNGSEDVPLKNKQARELYAEIAGRSYYAPSNNYTRTMELPKSKAIRRHLLHRKRRCRKSSAILPKDRC